MLSRGSGRPCNRPEPSGLALEPRPGGLAGAQHALHLTQEAREVEALGRGQVGRQETPHPRIQLAGSGEARIWLIFSCQFMAESLLSVVLLVPLDNLELSDAA